MCYIWGPKIQRKACGEEVGVQITSLLPCPSVTVLLSAPFWDLKSKTWIGLCSFSSLSFVLLFFFIEGWLRLKWSVILSFGTYTDFLILFQHKQQIAKRDMFLKTEGGEHSPFPSWKEIDWTSSDLSPSTFHQLLGWVQDSFCKLGLWWQRLAKTPLITTPKYATWTSHLLNLTFLN